MDTVMSARPTRSPPRTPCWRPRPVWLSASMRCTRLKDSASARSLAGSTPKASRLAKQVRAGNARRSGLCCVTLRIVVSPVSARPAPLHGRASSVRCVGAVWLRPAPPPGHERPREEWIEIPVPALVSEESFARAQELLQENKIRSRRRTIEPSVVQGLVSCQKCGYAFSRTSTCTSARKIHYYKCIGPESWRKLGGPVCDNRRLVRQDLLDQMVWAEVIRLLEDPTLIQQELDRRLAAARASDPTKKREQGLQRELIQVGKGIERLLTAYQEGLLSIEQLRQRMPSLRNREQMLRSELQAIIDQINDRAAFLRLAETLTAFL